MEVCEESDFYNFREMIGDWLHIYLLGEGVLIRGHSQCFCRDLWKIIPKPAIAAMHGRHSVFDIGHCTVIHCDAGGVSLVDQLKAEKIDICLTDQ